MIGNSALENSLKTSFIDHLNYDSDPELRAQLLVNQKTKNGGEYKKVLTEVLKELKECDSFDLSVAFITQGGITTIIKTLEEKAEKCLLKGRILTTDFNTFTDPRALRALAKNFPTLEIKIHRCDKDIGFHTKGFIFKYKGQQKSIIGSSNLTQNALTTNFEWNVRLVSNESGEISRIIQKEFDSLWNHPRSYFLSQVLDEYDREFQAHRAAQKAAQEEIAKRLPQKDRALRPNSMQKTFIRNLLNFYKEGKTKALLISATGTGKTYAAAFAIRSLLKEIIQTSDSHCSRQARVLFLVHRQQLALQARNSFARIIGTKDKTYEIVYGGTEDQSKAMGANFVFGTMQTISKDRVLKNINPTFYDVIVIDEVHRAGSESYQKIMDHLKPKLWLGMTASPDRPDGIDIYKLFDNNIAHEIRLQEALEYDLLVPFHYFGLTDLNIGSDQYKDIALFRSVQLEQRVDHVIRKAGLYGFSGDRVKGLVFCSTLEECEEMSDLFNQKGFKTVVVSGATSTDKRQEAIYKLVHGIGEERLDYIFSVEVFNEGVDIPEINQVILLRPTESPIIFVQQLGRGLRKAVGKEFVVVLDFIGNYKNNYLIPVALSGDNSYNKDRMRRIVSLGTRIIPGASTIEFEPIVRKKILDSIDTAKTNEVSRLRESYRILKRKLGRIPQLTDYEEHNGIDPIKFFQNKKYGSYYSFLKAEDKEFKTTLTKNAEKMLRYLSNKIGDAKRIEEKIVLELLMNHDEDVSKEFETILVDQYHVTPTTVLLESVMNVLSNNFNRNQQDQERNAGSVFLEKTELGGFKISREFKRELEQNGNGFRESLFGLLEFIDQRYLLRYTKHYKNTALVLNESYSYEDVCRLLNWPKNLPAQNIGGYFYEKVTNTLPVFVNYNKEEDAIAYEDRFESEKVLIALSKTNRTIDSSDVQRIYKTVPEYNDTKIYLFVRKNKDDKEAKSFTFLGEISATGEPKEVEIPSSSNPNKKEKAFEIRYVLETPVDGATYDYLRGE